MARPYAPLSVHFLDDPAVQRVSVLARYVFVVSLLVAKRVESDGVVSLSQLRRDCFDVDELQGKLAELVEANLLMRDGDEFTIRSWLKWNKSAAELEQHRERYSALGRRSAEVRKMTERPVERDVEPDVERDVERGVERTVQRVNEPTTTHPTPPQLIPPQPNGESDESDDRFDRALELVAGRQAEKSPTRTTPEAHRAGIVARMNQDGRTALLRQIVRDHPSARAERCVDIYEQRIQTLRGAS